MLEISCKKVTFVFSFILHLIGWKSAARKRDRVNLSFHMQVKRALNEIIFFIYRYLSGNQLACDCKLYGVFNASQHLPTFTGTCYKPDGLRNKGIESLKLLEFCRKYFKSSTQKWDKSELTKASSSSCSLDPLEERFKPYHMLRCRKIRDRYKILPLVEDDNFSTVSYSCVWTYHRHFGGKTW